MGEGAVKNCAFEFFGGGGYCGDALAEGGHFKAFVFELLDEVGGVEFVVPDAVYFVLVPDFADALFYESVVCYVAGCNFDVCLAYPLAII